ncbi:MAG: DUF6603 domain-containing protein [Bacteroidota bacterium]
MLPIPKPIASSNTASGLALIPLLQGELSTKLYFTKNIYLKLTGAFGIDGEIIQKFYPDEITLDANLGDTSIKASMELIGDPPQPWVLIGSETTNRLELGGFKLGLALGGQIDDPVIVASLGTGDPKTNNNPRLSFVFVPKDVDGFFGSVVGEEAFRIDFQSNLIWSSRDGLAFEGQVGFEVLLPIHFSLGVIEITSLYIAMRGGMPTDDVTAKADLGVSLKGNLGPVSFVIENIGTSLLLESTEQSTSGGLLGDEDLNLGFKPPNGIGLAIDASVIKGGGYLRFDPDREEYAGNLELVFSEWIALKAIGLITTKMPDGSRGFSMVIIITAEFGSGIQLGFGFTLLGVGGILGVNRVVNVEPLKDGVRTGGVESVLFPQNVVANAPRIISDLRAFFPVQEGQFLIGPMAKIGYDTPTLASLSLGVIIEFPDVNITILGVLKVVLPDEQADILRLQVNFLGRVEPSNNLLWFYAELYDSRILFITLEGGMGLLVNWGDEANFVFSIGGFHPRYSPPPLPFNIPPRLAVNILNESAAKIRIEGYFAVTSNTVQFGARAELYFGFSALKVEGHLSFDVLIQFSPFYFIFEFSAGLSVKVFGFGLFSISVSGMLEGPSKWHIKGKAKWKITWLGPTIKVNIDETWGQEKQSELPPIEVFPLLEREYEAITNWQAVVPSSSSLLVTLRKLEEPTAPSSDQEPETRPLVLHPVGSLRISQRKMPLNLKLDKLGNQRPSDVNELSISAVIGSNLLSDPAIIREQFAKGEFKDLNKSQRLSNPGFEKYNAGIELKTEGSQVKTSQAIRRIIRYETIIVDNNFKRHAYSFFEIVVQQFQLLRGRLFGHFLRGNAVTKSPISVAHRARLQPRVEGIKIEAHRYTVAHVKDNTPITIGGEITTAFSTQAEAFDFMQAQVDSNPNVSNEFHVIPNTEVNETLVV